MKTPDTLRLAVGIATKGRASTLAHTLDQIRKQHRPPDRIIVCYTQPEDIAGLDLSGDVALRAAAGLAHQRNVILDAVDDCDVVLFVDDDFLMDQCYVGATCAAIELRTDIVVTTGRVIADGINGPGLTPAAGAAILAADPGPAEFGEWSPVPHGNGCNMALRLSPIRRNHLRFDEALPLYGWYEDIDFTRRLGQHGQVIRLEGARGVHLGVKSGRTSGVRLGYSQIANPIYLARKGTYSWRAAMVSIGRNALANTARSLWSEPYIDRPGRLSGNLTAIADLSRGRLHPRRILDL